MRDLTYFIGTSIDGFIADDDGRFDFFPFEEDVAAAIVADHPETLPVHARRALGIEDVPNEVFDAVVMGRATYEPALQAGLTSPYPHLRQVVFSRTLEQGDPEVEIVSGDPVAHVRALKREDGLGVWLCGGAELAGQLVDEIDRLVVKRYPIILGAGIPMFRGPFALRELALNGTRTFESGATFSTYARR
ncbi:dihydrofolate reductase family protein [Nocardioides euryhalodurans]|uniref:Dihydrofolate reductase n=1 Tax=Nocardioides euryhalodurans TaxID=2518370 RepID=A0A4P7GJT1_9ACTN|nr:dihydrofolate reductase family protein [Nocardioides euryhalodurans]QBR92256.1 dihydrofolate reductase [Nocardioides euryhalodurans]